MKYVSQPVTVDAIQWRGDNLREIQDFLAPLSPLLRPTSSDTTTAPAIGVSVYDAEATATYAALGKQYKLAHAAVTSWIVRQSDGDLLVVTDSEFAARYQPALSDGNALPDHQPMLATP